MEKPQDNNLTHSPPAAYLYKVRRMGEWDIIAATSSAEALKIALLPPTANIKLIGFALEETRTGVI